MVEKSLKNIVILSLSMALIFSMSVSQMVSAFVVPGENELVSIATDGTLSNNTSLNSEISGDGKFVAFSSDATNLVPNDTNGMRDVFLRDRVSGTTERISVTSSGEQAAGGTSRNPAISHDGRYVVFSSTATNLAPNDTNGTEDIFLYDTVNQTTQLVSANSSGQLGNSSSSYPDITSDGRYVVFQSHSSNLVSGINPSGVGDHIFRKDMQTGNIIALSVTSSGGRGNGSSVAARTSCDGNVVVFVSRASNLVPGDTNNFGDIFLAINGSNGFGLTNITKDIQRVYEIYNFTDISCDGNFITFGNGDGSFVPNDTNGYGDIFVYSRITGLFEKITSNNSQVASGNTENPRISGDGRFVSFGSERNLDSSRIVQSGGSGRGIYLYDRQTGVTRGVMVDVSGRC